MTRRPAKGTSARAFMAGFSSAGRVSTEPAIVHTELEVPSGSRHERAVVNTPTTHFAVCPICQESLSVAGHDDADCPRCGQFCCSSFGCRCEARDAEGREELAEMAGEARKLK